jgi:hypothetical protein
LPSFCLQRKHFQSSTIDTKLRPLIDIRSGFEIPGFPETIRSLLELDSKFRNPYYTLVPDKLQSLGQRCLLLLPRQLLKQARYKSSLFINSRLLSILSNNLSFVMIPSSSNSNSNSNSNNSNNRTTVTTATTAKTVTTATAAAVTIAAQAAVIASNSTSINISIVLILKPSTAPDYYLCFVIG